MPDRIDGAALRRARNALGWEVAELAAEVSKVAVRPVRRNTVSAWEQRTGVPVRHLDAVRRVIGAAIDWAQSDTEDALEQWLERLPVEERPVELAQVDGEELRRARLLRGLSQENSAQLFSVSPKRYRDWERTVVSRQKAERVSVEFERELALVRGAPTASLDSVGTEELIAELQRRTRLSLASLDAPHTPDITNARKAVNMSRFATAIEALPAPARAALPSRPSGKQATRASVAAWVCDVVRVTEGVVEKLGARAAVEMDSDEDHAARRTFAEMMLHQDVISAARRMRA